MNADAGTRMSHIQVVLSFDLRAEDTGHFLAARSEGHRFVFQRRRADRALTYVWLAGDVFQPAEDLSGKAWRAEIERRLASVSLAPGAGPAPFPGGAMAFLGYDALCASRFGWSRPRHGESDGPAVLVAFTRVFAVLDHHAARGHLIALAAEGTDTATIRAGLAARLAAIRAQPAQAASPADGPDWSTDTGAAEYEARVRDIQRLIASGAIEQMILSVGLDRAAPLDPVAAFMALVRDNPSPHAFLIGSGAFGLIGASPLLHLSIEESRRVTIETDAGTRPAGETAAEAERHAEELLASVKDAVEQRIISQATLRDLEAIATPGSIRTVIDREIRRFSHTMHLYTVMQGELRPEISSLRAMLACAPAAALVGAPKQGAADAIERIERAPRGPYGGLVALLGHDGSLDSTVVLRSLWSDGTRVRLRSGGGITAASDPDEEYREAVQKARTVLHVTGATIGTTPP